MNLPTSLKIKKKVVDNIDRFIFYGNRDGFGYWIPSKEYDSSQYSPVDNTIVDCFSHTLQEYSSKRLIFNKFRFGEKFLFCNGISSEEKLTNFKINSYYNSQIDINTNNYNSNYNNSQFTLKEEKK